ncbi:MAG TPA: formate dehydrogenase subunit alpha [Herpetosiphonaceae bacterium]
MKTVNLTIDGHPAIAQPGDTVLQVAQQHGISIPTLCHHPDLTPVGSCRLCLVEVDGLPNPVSACTLRIRDGMVVRTETPALTEARRGILSLLLCSYTAPVDGCDTEFLRLVRRYGAQVPEGIEPEPPCAVDSDPNPFVRVDLNRCILCTRCIRACNEIQGRFVWHPAGRGSDMRLVAAADTTMLAARCESCGLCAAYCPTGALSDKLSAGLPQPDRLVRTTCSYCGVGCQLDLNLKDNTIVGVTSAPAAPVNGMALCVKGRYGYGYVNHAERLRTPQVRRYLLEGTAPRARPADRGEWAAVSWETALDLVATKLEQVRRDSGADTIGVLASAKCTNEENYLMQKFARQVLGTHNVDHCARLCHASTVAGLAMCFGSGAMSNTMTDVTQHAQAMLIIGSNTTEQHPVFGAQIRQAVLRRGMKLVVADPRRIDMAEFATLHLRQRPGTDIALINGILQIVLANGWQDQRFIDERCEDFDEFRATVARYTPEVVAGITGVAVVDLHHAAEILARSRPMAVVWAMGITQHTSGVLNVLSLGNLQMLLGNLGVPGGGVNPLRGQNNVQGACDMGALPNVYPGYQPVASVEAAQRFAAAWRLTGTEAYPALSQQQGLTVTELTPRAGDGTIRALYIMGEDPALTEPDANNARACLEACEFLVVQEILPSATAEYADVLLPGASFAEKDGTFTNTERRIQRVRRALDPPGEARPDWAIIAELARRVLRLQARVPSGQWAGWNYAAPAQIMDEIAALTPSYAGVSYDRLERGEQLHWPVKSYNHPGTPILHVGSFTRGKGRFHAVDYLPPHEQPDAEYPLLLTTGRVLYHWHGGELTRRVAALMEVCPEPLVEISPEDARALGLRHADPILVRSRRGTMAARALITDRVAPGVVFANFHFPGPQNANNLTVAALDPIAKIPEYKVCAARIEAAVDGGTLNAAR